MIASRGNVRLENAEYSKPSSLMFSKVWWSINKFSNNSPNQVLY